MERKTKQVKMKQTNKLK